MITTRLDLDRIRAARRMVDPVFLDTPQYRCDALGSALGCTVSIKLETANPVRSFKGRGTELVASLLAEQGRTAVVCASAGNLGQALGWYGPGQWGGFIASIVGAIIVLFAYTKLRGDRAA